LGLIDDSFGIELANCVSCAPTGDVGRVINLARRSTMALHPKAVIVVRSRRSWLVAVPMIAVSLAIGCSHNRQSYRPIYASPATAAPCTNCGSSSSAPAPVTTEEPGLAPAAPAPALSGPSSESTVPLLNGSGQPGTGQSRSSTVESMPKAQIGPDPGFDEVPSATSNPRGSARPAPPSGSGSSGRTPPLQAPNSQLSPSSWNVNAQRDQRLGAPAPKLVRRTNLGEQLRPYIEESSANELFYPNKADRPWRYVVLHHSAAASGNYDQIDHEHRKILGYDGCGYHFIIGNGTGSGDGVIEVAQRWNNQKQGVHCRNARSHDVDEYGIGICLVGDFEQQPPTPRQIAATQALIAYLAQRYRIQPASIATHAHLAANPTICPGKFFPSESILSAARAATAGRDVRTTLDLAPRSSRLY
jgi:N-acetyl-anhydromuramyl-L-alanine amidase AmpD